jgi:hypothetical protein
LVGDVAGMNTWSGVDGEMKYSMPSMREKTRCHYIFQSRYNISDMIVPEGRRTITSFSRQRRNHRNLEAVRLRNNGIVKKQQRAWLCLVFGRHWSRGYTEGHPDLCSPDTTESQEQSTEQHYIVLGWKQQHHGGINVYITSIPWMMIRVLALMFFVPDIRLPIKRPLELMSQDYASVFEPSTFPQPRGKT